MTVSAEKKQASFKPEVQELADKIAKGISIKKTGESTIEENLYESHLPEGLTMETVSNVRRYTSNFIAAGQHAFGVAAVDAMKKNDDLFKLSDTVSLGDKDSVTYTVERNRTFMVHVGANKDNPKPVLKHGICAATVVMAGTSGSAGQLKIARTHVGAYAAKLLG